MPKKPTPAYVIALEEGDDGDLYTFSDPALWAWLNTEITFPYNATRMTMSIPGTTAKATVTIGSTQNDLAQALVLHLSGIGVTEVHTDDYKKKLAKLTMKVGAGHVYSGLWY